MNCLKCGKELRVFQKMVGTDEKGNPIWRQCGACDYCKTEMDLGNYSPKKKRSTPLIVIGVIVVAIVVLAAIGSLGSSDNKQDVGQNEQQSINETQGKEYIEITASDLIDAFNENQVNCKNLYDKKDIKVTGAVKSVGTDILDQVYVCLNHDNDYVVIGIQCYAKNKTEEDKISKLKEGDVITVVGVGDCGSLSFSLKDAEIIDR